LKNKNSPAIKQKQEHQLVAAQFSGPIPSPEVFKQYGMVVPDAPERILQVFEKDSEHTREMQKIALQGEIDRDSRGQWMAFIIMIASLGLTAIAIIYQQNIAGIVTGLATLFMALKVLYGNKNSSSKNDN
jgi:uncharacterized membrane protein